MKRSSNKKNYVVVRLNDYDNTWRELTTPATFLQAVRWVSWHSYGNFVNQGIMKILTLDELAQLQQKETA